MDNHFLGGKKYMLNILIADDNIYYAKTLINYIMADNEEMRLVNISTNGQEVLESIRSEHIDLVILDLKMPIMSGHEVIANIKKLNLSYKPIIIVVSGEESYMQKNIDNCMIACSINKLSGLDAIKKIILETIQETTKYNNIDKIKDKILSELLSLGFSIKHNGTKYLLEAITLAYEDGKQKEDNEKYADNLEHYLYKRIAHNHAKSVGNIKGNITKAANYMYTECEQSKLLKYFSFSHDEKPTPKIIINTILSKL